MAKVDLIISIIIQLLEYLLNDVLFFGVLGKRAAETASSDSPRAPPGPHPLGLSGGGPGVLIQ